MTNRSNNTNNTRTSSSTGTAIITSDNNSMDDEQQQKKNHGGGGTTTIPQREKQQQSSSSSYASLTRMYKLIWMFYLIQIVITAIPLRGLFSVINGLKESDCCGIDLMTVATSKEDGGGVTLVPIYITIIICVCWLLIELIMIGKCLTVVSQVHNEDVVSGTINVNNIEVMNKYFTITSYMMIVNFILLLFIGYITTLHSFIVFPNFDTEWIILIVLQVMNFVINMASTCLLIHQKTISMAVASTVVTTSNYSNTKASSNNRGVGGGGGSSCVLIVLSVLIPLVSIITCGTLINKHYLQRDGICFVNGKGFNRDTNSDCRLCPNGLPPTYRDGDGGFKPGYYCLVGDNNNDNNDDNNNIDVQIVNINFLDDDNDDDSKVLFGTYCSADDENKNSGGGAGSSPTNSFCFFT